MEYLPKQLKGRQLVLASDQAETAAGRFHAHGIDGRCNAEATGVAVEVEVHKHAWGATYTKLRRKPR